MPMKPVTTYVWECPHCKRTWQPPYPTTIKITWKGEKGDEKDEDICEDCYERLFDIKEDN